MLTDKILYLDKTRTLPNDQDYEFLRSEGLKYIEELASDLWTDYNTHDPGITILEALCYAITELGYRTDFDIKDLLAGEYGKIDTDQAFFSAKNILTSEPLTIEDYRKILVDRKGVKNAWLYPYRDSDFKLVGEPDQEVPLYAHCKKDALVYDETDHPVKLHGLYNVVLDLEETDELGDLNNGNLIFQFPVPELLNLNFQLLFPYWDQIDYELVTDSHPYTIDNISVVNIGDRWNVTFDVTLGGDTQSLHFQAFVLMKKDVSAIKDVITAQFNDSEQITQIFSLYKKKIESITAIIHDAKDTLNAHRNLCEDFLPLKTVCTQDVAFCADIEVTPDTDIEEVYANVLFELENYLNPEVKFYSLKELVNEGIPSEEIFEGPVLDHGFIKTDELKATQIRTEIIVSDIINFIMDIDGVRAVKNVLLTKYDSHENPILPSERWCLKVDDGCKPVLNIFRSKVLFFKGKLPFRPRLDETLDTLKYLHGLESRNKLHGTAGDYDMPEGAFRNPEDYLSVQYEFPMTYGIGDAGLPDTADDLRRAQAKQLKAYLMFYDQALANFFSQMSHAKDLFSLDVDIRQTYFGQYVKVIKGIEEIYNHPADLEKVLSAPDPSDSPEIISARSRLMETRDVFYDRRNRFLDHLIARFAESFNDYVLMLYTYKNADQYSEIDADELLKDKITFLKDYKVISRERGKAFDYLSDSWDTDNVSGLEKRLARLSGIDDFTRRFLFCLKRIEIQKTDDTPPKYYFRVIDEDGTILIKSTKEYDSFSEITDVALKLSDVFDDASSYKTVDVSSSKFSFNIVDSSNNVLAESGVIYPNADDRNNAITDISGKLAEDCPGEGMHLVEHLLLRPRFSPKKISGETPEETYKLFEVCLGDDCQFCGEEDPYSFRLSLILPYWHDRFESPEFRKFFDTIARTESPAHCMIKICFINNTLMNTFERAYKEWMEALKDYEEDLIFKDSKQEKLRLASNKMIEILTVIHSEYPEAHLYDCSETTQNPVLLNNAILGTYKI